MGFFSRKSKPKASNGFFINEYDEILGYMDEVTRKRISVTFVYKHKNNYTDILMIEHKHKALRIQMGRGARIPNGAEVMAGFALDKTWWAFKTKFVLIDDKPHLLIPQLVKHSERRKKPRTNFSVREQVKVTVLEGLGTGNGVFGLAKEVSITGMSLTIEKAMKLSNEKEIPPTPTLFQSGKKLALVKINKIPGTTLIETTGIAKRVDRDGKWYFAFQFDSLSKPHEMMINRFIEPRILDFKPTRRSYKKRQEMEQARNAAPPPSAQKAPEPLAAEKSCQSKTLVVGNELMKSLAYLKEESIDLLPGLTPVSIIKILTEDQPKNMVCAETFKGRSIVEMLERVENMGILKNVNVVVCAGDLQAKDRVKLKMMNVTHIHTGPLDDKDAIVAQLAR